MAAALADDPKALGACCQMLPCERYTPGFARWTLPDGTLSDVCPRLLVTPLSADLIRWHDRYRRGVLPRTGGLYEQTALYMDAMDYLDEVRG